MIVNEEDKKEAVKVIKMLNRVAESSIVSENTLYKARIDKVRNSIRQELGAYLARKELKE